MPDVFAVANLLVDLVRSQAADDVALIVYYGSHATGTATPKSDLDLYYIPDDGKGAELYRSITYQGCPFEFWPVSWAFAERIASGKHHWAVAPSIIANARILYARSSADEARFAALQARIARLQQPESRGEMIRLAQEAYQAVTAPLHQLALAAAAKDRAGAQWPAVQTVDAVLDCLALILAETRAHRAAHPDLSPFHGYYPAIKEYVNKILGACEHGDWVNASVTAAKMQKELTMLLAATEDGIAYSDFNILGEYRATSDRL